MTYEESSRRMANTSAVSEPGSRDGVEDDKVETPYSLTAAARSQYPKGDRHIRFSSGLSADLDDVAFEVMNFEELRASAVLDRARRHTPALKMLARFFELSLAGEDDEVLV